MAETRTLSKRTIIALGVVAVVVIAATALVFYHYQSGSGTTTEKTETTALIGTTTVTLNGSTTVTLQTWTLWGMTIGHPAGLTAQGQGVYQQLATPESGIATWTWNGGNTSLYLEWVPASASNYSNSFQGVPVRLQGHSVSGITVVSQGSVSMAGATWEYKTERVTFGGGLTAYMTSATSYYPSSHRGYLLAYVDTSQSTMNSLETYGNTFHG